ncbi:hypothetical protein F4780DRAFT_506261 [Xylariomycetidae sp. FL0641]|nr:hypothetical protein F4780DRAFT_506261 [Xylariomycetidae sp. FL0641]
MCYSLLPKEIARMSSSILRGLIIGGFNLHCLVFSMWSAIFTPHTSSFRLPVRLLCQLSPPCCHSNATPLPPLCCAYLFSCVGLLCLSRSAARVHQVCCRPGSPSPNLIPNVEFRVISWGLFVVAPRCKERLLSLVPFVSPRRMGKIPPRPAVVTITGA